MDPWTGRYLAHARIDALLREAASERLAAQGRGETGLIADHDPARGPVARAVAAGSTDDASELERSAAAGPSLWSMRRRRFVASPPRSSR